MQKFTDTYNFCIDKINTDGCAGWYARKDGKPNLLIVCVKDRYFELPAVMLRPDIEKGGLGDRHCGFDIKFVSPLRNGDKVTIKTQNNEILYETNIKSAIPDSDKQRERLLKLVEPFLELDIKKVKSALIGNQLFYEYKNMYKQSLAFKENDSLKDEIIDILADLKATVHLLSAAYLDQCRRERTSTIMQLLNAPYVPEEELQIDMRADITGTGWGQSEKEGRWTSGAGSATLKLPALSPGLYEVQLEITAVSAPSLLEDIDLYVNDINTPLEIISRGLVSILNGKMVLAQSNQSALTLHFAYHSSKELDVPDNGKERFRLKSISINKIS